MNKNLILVDRKELESIVSNAIQTTKALAGASDASTDIDQSEQRPILLTDYMQEYVEQLASGERQKHQSTQCTSRGYIANMRSVKRSIEAFETSTHHKITLDEMDMPLQRHYIQYLRTKGNHPNTIQGKMSMLRTIFQAAYLDGKSRNEIFRHPEFVPAGEVSNQIYLMPEHIQQMLALDLSTEEAVRKLFNETNFRHMRKFPTVNALFAMTFQITRDIFIVGCLTGQRISDYSRISSQMIVKIQDIDFICIEQKKTRKTVFIPLDKRVYRIIDKYHGVLPKVSQPTMNRNLRYLGEILGWTWRPNVDLQHTAHKFGTRFCDMITTHTARRSFATNAYSAGIALSSIMAVTGHCGEKNLRRYLRMEAEEKALKAARDFQNFLLR